MRLPLRFGLVLLFLGSLSGCRGSLMAPTVGSTPRGGNEVIASSKLFRQPSRTAQWGTAYQPGVAYQPGIANSVAWAPGATVSPYLAGTPYVAGSPYIAASPYAVGSPLTGTATPVPTAATPLGVVAQGSGRQVASLSGLPNPNGPRRHHGHRRNGMFRPGSRAAKARASADELQNGARPTGVGATPGEDLHYRGGKTVANLKFVNIYVGGQQAWDPNDRQMIDWALTAAMSDVNLNNVMQQYFEGQPISSERLQSYYVEGLDRNTVTQDALESAVASLHQQGALANFDLNTTVFNFLLPKGTVLTDDDSSSAGGQETGEHKAEEEESKLTHSAIPHEDEANSLGGLGGFHGSVHPNGATVYYAVGVYSEKRADGSMNGIPFFSEPWKNVVATFYHELQEFRTDPDVEDAIRGGNDPNAERYLGWTSDRGEECGDYPVEANFEHVFVEVPLADGSGMVPVQYQYSNAVHGPEGPIPAPHGNTRPIPGNTTPKPSGTPSQPANPPPANPQPSTPATPPAGNPAPSSGDTGLQRIEKAWPTLPNSTKIRMLHVLDAAHR